MNEREWVKSIIKEIENKIRKTNDLIRVSDGFKLSYSFEILSYKDAEPIETSKSDYETDILISELLENGTWKPRVIIEAKINSVTTHDAITYSQKAQAHKNVHPYLRYGIIIGNREHHPLPGRLFRHGQHFDFMNSWKGFTADESELEILIKIILEEINASKTLDKIIYNSRSSKREKFTVLHKPLILKS